MSEWLAISRNENLDYIIRMIHSGRVCTSSSVVIQFAFQKTEVEDILSEFLCTV